MSALATVFRFATWAQTLGHVPTAEDVATQFGVSRATAYRWRKAFCEATGQPTDSSLHAARVRRIAWNAWFQS